MVKIIQSYAAASLIAIVALYVKPQSINKVFFFCAPAWLMLLADNQYWQWKKAAEEKHSDSIYKGNVEFVFSSLENFMIMLSDLRKKL